MGADQIPKSVADVASEDSHDDPSDEFQKPVSRLTRWYRSPLFNVIIVGLISFTQPGIWNALNSKCQFPL
jgi:hypothetical protein